MSAPGSLLDARLASYKCVSQPQPPGPVTVGRGLASWADLSAPAMGDWLDKAWGVRLKECYMAINNRVLDIKLYPGSTKRTCGHVNTAECAQRAGLEDPAGSAGAILSGIIFFILSELSTLSILSLYCISNPQNTSDILG